MTMIDQLCDHCNGDGCHFCNDGWRPQPTPNEDQNMTTAEAFAAVYSMIQGSDRISEFYKDSDDYWTGYVETEDGETCFVSMPDWYPEGISIDWSI